jgi:hypothetical protein
MEKLCILLVIAPPSGPIVSSIDEVLSDIMEGDIAARFLLYGPIGTNVIAMAMGVHNAIDLAESHPQKAEQLLCLLQVAHIAGIDEDCRLAAVDEVIGVEIPPLNKEEVLEYLLSPVLVSCHVLHIP